MEKDRKLVIATEASGLGRESEFFHALNAAAATLQRSVRSEENVLRAFSEQIEMLNLIGMISLFDETGEYLVTHAIAHSNATIKTLEKLSDIKAEGFKFPVKDVDVFQEVVATGKTIFVPNICTAITQIVPKSARFMLSRFIQAFGCDPAIFAPFRSEGDIRGVLSITGPGLTARDISAMEAFANHITIAIENARLLEQERQRRTEAETLRQATAALTFTLNLDAVLETILTRLKEVVDYDSATVFLHEGDHLHGKAARGLPAPEFVVGHNFPADDLLFNEIRRTRRSLILEDAQNESRFQRWAGTDYIRGWMGIPLIAQDKVIGYLTCDSRKIAIYTPVDASLAEAFANQAAIAIENARLFEAERAAREQAETLRELAKAVSSSLDLHVTLRLILEQLKRVLTFDTSSVLLVGGNGKPALVVRIGNADEEQTSQETGELLSDSPILSQMAQDLQPVIIPDVRQHPGWVVAPGAEYVRSFLGVPIIGYRSDQNLIGAVMVDSKQANFFGQSHINIVQSLAQHMAIAIENARLFEAERAQLLLAKTLHKVGALLTSQLGLNEVLENILDLLGQVVKYDSVSIQLIDDEGILHLAAGRGFPDIQLARQIVRDNSSNLIRDDWTEHRVLVIPDTHADSRWTIYQGAEYICSWIGAPLLVKGRFIGSLNVDSRTVNAYDSATGETVIAFANQAAIAIENARLFEIERQRIAELEAVRQASLSLTASLELPQVLDAILRSALSLLPEAANAHIFLYNPEGNGRLIFGAALWAGGRMERPWSEPRQHGLTYTVARKGEVIVVPDMHCHPLYKDAPPEWSGSIVGLPLKIGPQVVGVMNVMSYQPRQIPEAELHLMQLLGDQAATAIENARLFEQAATERRHLSLLYDLSWEIASSLDPNEILTSAITLTCQALEGLVGEAFLYLPDENRLSLRALFGRKIDPLPKLDTSLSLQLGTGLAGWVAQHKEAVNIDDVNLDPRWIHISGLDDDVASALSAPILAADQLLGVLSVLHHQPSTFSTEHLALIQAICREVGLALSNANRYQQIQRRLAEITLIQSLAQTFNQRLEVQILLEEVARQLAKQLGYSRVRIFLIEEDKLVSKAFYGPCPVKEIYPISYGIIGRAVRTGETIFIPDASSDPEYPQDSHESISELAAPIFRGEAVVGVINIQNEQPEQLTSQDRDLLQVLAGQISVALENAVLYERVRNHAENLERIVTQRTAELTELYQLSQEISYQLSYEDLLHLLLHHLRNAVRSEFAMGCLGGRDCRSLSIETDRPIAPAVISEIHSRWLETLAISGVYVPEPEQIQSEVIQAEDFNPEKLPIQRLVSIIQAPIYAEGKLVGMLLAGSEKTNAFGAEQERLLSTFANQAATAVQRLAMILTAQQRQLESLVEHLPVGVLLLDAEFRLLVANPLGRELLSVLNAESSDGMLDQLGTYTLGKLTERQGNLLPVEVTLEGPPRRIFAIQIRPAGSPSGDDVRQWVLTVSEITQERENMARIQIQERLATVGQLAAGIAHDFNNIMAAILVYTDLLRYDSSISPTSQEKLAIIQKQVERASSLIRQILDFSRKSVIEQSTFDLLPFIKELDKMLTRVLPETIRLELSHLPGAYWVNGDPTRLQQVFINLALNAQDAMPEGGILYFELSHWQLHSEETSNIPHMPPGEWVRITVTDTGVGIPPEAREHIFEPFFTTKPVGEGTGLGLAQVYGIVRQHDGYIDVQSQVGRGASFIIYLPALDVGQESQVLPESPDQFYGRGQTVLVVEDDLTTQQALQASLETHGYNVLLASNGIEALQCFEQAEEPVVLVISDMVMPEMGGVALHNALKERFPKVKMLFITGHPIREDDQALLEEGNVHWLQKPFSVQDFNQAVNDLLQDE